MSEGLAIASSSFPLRVFEWLKRGVWLLGFLDLQKQKPVLGF